MKSLKSLEKGEYPNEKFQEYLGKLNNDEIILQFTKEDSIYQIKYDNENFNLYQGEIPLKVDDYVHLNLKNKIGTFNTIDEFWTQLTTNKNWFIDVASSKTNQVMEKFIITSHNRILEQGEISYKEHEKLHSWMNTCFNRKVERNVYWQFCSNCRERVFYNPRYPKHACRNCVNLIKDEFGNQLDYQNTHELFGSRFRLKSSQTEVKIFIDKDEYWAEEARFGGIVHQKKEKN